MRKFLIRVDGMLFQGLYPCSVDAVVDALDIFPAARRISVKALP